MSVLKRSLVLLYSFKQSYSVIRAHFLIAMFFCFFFVVVVVVVVVFSCFVLQNQYTVAECNGAVDLICETLRLDEGLAPSFSFLLKAGFECGIVQRSMIYDLNSHLLTLAFLSTF